MEIIVLTCARTRSLGISSGKPYGPKEIAEVGSHSFHGRSADSIQPSSLTKPSRPGVLGAEHGQEGRGDHQPVSSSGLNTRPLRESVF